MHQFQKIFWILITFIISINATDLNQIQICQPFSDGIQTQNNTSKIKFIDHSYLFNNPDNLLDGSEVINSNSTLSCRDVNNTTDEECQSSNSLGYSLESVTRQTPQSFTLSLPVTSATNKIKFKQDGGTTTGTLLREQEYKSVKSDWYPDLNMTFDITNSLKVQLISTTDAQNTALRFKSADGNPYDIEIKKLLLKKKTDASSDSLAQNIKIKTLQVNKKNTLLLKATTSISIEKLDIDKNSTIIIKAPKIVINDLKSLKRSSIKIIANEIDITDIRLENRADLTIESYDEDTHIDMRIDKLKLDKAYTILNSGEYHIKRVELKNRSELSVGESVQIINRRVIVLNHSLINASKDIAICDDTHNSNALFIYADDLVRVEDGSKIVGFVYIDRRIELTNHAGIKGAISSKNRAILTNHSKVCYTSCDITLPSVDTTPPVITLNGDANITITKGDEYIELNATAVDDVDGDVNVTISGEVNSSVVGVYTIRYTALDSANNSASKIRTVSVVEAPDTTAPIIMLNGDSNITITQGEEYVELNATAIDDVDGNVSVSISGDVNSSKVGVYLITYTATDSSNNSATKTRTVNVIEAPDTTPPVITLNGDAEITLTQGSLYSELGATAVDDVDGNISVTVSGSVDTATVGTYTITYSATDSAGNEATLTREVNVVEPVVEYGVKVGEVQGNTARYHYFATFDITLKSQPEANVTIPLFSSDTNEGKIVEGHQLIFTPDNWNQPQKVVVQGQNQNVINGVQNYTIILDSIISNDDNYDGIDPNDVEMRGLILVLKQQEDLTCIAGFKKRIKIEAEYNGQKSLSYTLIEKPDGMIINTQTGKISWTAPLIAEGSSYFVKVKVSDGLFIREMSFNITVANSTPIEAEVNETVVTVTDDNHLNGFKFRFTDGSSIPTIKTISEDSLPLLSNGITRLSDYFYSLDEHDGRVEILMPLSILNSMNDASRLVIYHDSYQEGWLSLPVELKIEDIKNIKYISMSISTLKGSIFFVGLMPKIKNHQTYQKSKGLKHIQKRDSNPISISVSNIHCNKKELPSPLVSSYYKQTCTIDGIDDTNFTVIGFGDINGSKTMWNPPTSIEEMMVWIGESRSEYATNLEMGDLNQEINITLDGANGNLGYVLPKDLVEQGNVLHLSNRVENKSLIQATVAHEHFHHAQAKTTRFAIGSNIFDYDEEENEWIVEGTAMWAEDYLYDGLNQYTAYLNQPLLKILEYGLTSNTYEQQNYESSLFWKLISTKCKDMEINLKKIFYADFEHYPFIDIVQLVLNDSTCNFGNSLGSNNKSSIASAMLYYQYATTQENKISLLDANENNANFNFEDAKSIPKGAFEYLTHYPVVKNEIPDYGATSFKLEYNDIKDKSKNIKLSIKTDRPLTVVGIRLDKNANSTPLGADNNFHFTTQADVSKEYNLTDEDKEGGLFITLLNATEDKVNILDLNITEKKKKAVAEYLFEHNTEDTAEGKYNLLNWRTGNPPLNMQYNDNGKMGASGIFDASDDSCLVINYGVPNLNWGIDSGNASFSFWVKMYTSNTGIFGSGVYPGSGAHGFQFQHINNRFVYKHRDTKFRMPNDGRNDLGAGGTKYFNNTNIAINEWNHVVVIFEDSKIYPRVYLNKVELTDVNIYEPYYDNTPPRNAMQGFGMNSNIKFIRGNIGITDRHTSYFQGELDTFRVYDFPLSQAEIDDLYEEGN